MSTSAAAALAKKRVRRQKQILAAGTVLLLAVLGFQLPKLLGGHGSQTLAPVTTAASSLPVAPPLAASGALRDTDRFAVQRDANQLLSFGLFKSKDPFVQQLSATAAPAVTPAPATPPAAVPARAKKATPGGSAAPGVAAPTSAPPAPAVITQPAPTPTSTVASTPVIPPTVTSGAPVPVTPAPAAAEPTSVPISTNGVCEQVALKGTFPASESIFRLVEIAKTGKSIKIAIVGGSYDSGQPTATVKLGEKLTLVNTSDGSRFVIVLEANCTATAGKTAGASPPVLTPPAPPQAPAAAPSTTPIVTDAYDTTPRPSG